MEYVSKTSLLFMICTVKFRKNNQTEILSDQMNKIICTVILMQVKVKDKVYIQ